MFRYVPLLLTLVSLPAQASNWRGTSGLRDRATFQTLISSLDSADTPIDAWAVEPDGDWFVVAGGAVYNSSTFSADMVTAAKLNLWFGRTIRAADCTETGRCVLVHSAGYYANGAMPAGLTTTINSWTSSGYVIRDVEITDSGFLLLGPGSAAAYSGLDADLSDAVYDRHATGRTILDVALGTDGRWMLLADQNPMHEGLSASQVAVLDSVVMSEAAVDKLLLGSGSTYVVYNGDDDTLAVDTSDPFSVIELTAGGTNLWERMDSFGAVGVSIAVVEGNTVVAGRGYGLRELGADGAVLSSTPFDLASLSKYVGALTTLATLEVIEADRDAGNDLFLDDDVLDLVVPGGDVERWKADGELATPTKGFPDGLDPLHAGMTFRRLLSHTAGMLTRGSTPSEVPYVSSVAVSNWMSGWDCSPGPCDWSTSAYAWTDASFGAAGDEWNYSNAGFLLTQATLGDHTGSSGATLMQELLFDALGLEDTSAFYPLDEDFLARRSRQHDTVLGLAVENEYPWTFGGGVNASAADYAELVILGMNEGRSSEGAQIVSEAGIQELLTDVSLNDGTGAGYGLGVALPQGSVTETNGRGFWHNGGHPAQAVTWFCAVPERDQAIVVLVNTDTSTLDASDAADMSELVDDIVDAYRSSVGWSSAVNCGL